jgi:hypothetical protein
MGLFTTLGITNLVVITNVGLFIAMLSIVILSLVKLTAIMLCHYMLNVVMHNAVMLSVSFFLIMPSDLILCVALYIVLQFSLLGRVSLCRVPFFRASRRRCRRGSRGSRRLAFYSQQIHFFVENVERIKEVEIIYRLLENNFELNKKMTTPAASSLVFLLV